MYPRSTCASLFVLFLLWGIAWVVRQALRSIGMQPETATEEGQAGSSQPGQQQKSDISSKVSKVSDILRNSLLALLVAIFLNTALSTGQPRSVLVLSWILLFFAIIWAITEAVSPFKQVAAAFSLTVYALAISIGALAFANSLY